MSKKNRRNNKTSNTQTSNATQPVSLRPEVNKVNAALGSVKDMGVTVSIEFDETLAKKFQEALPEQATEMKSWLNSFADVAKQTKYKYQALEQQQEDLEIRQLEIEEQEEKIKQERFDLHKLKNQVEPEKKNLEKLRNELVNRERDVLSREDDAQNEFSRLNDESLSELKSEKAEFESNLAALKREIQVVEQGLADTLQDKISELDQKQLDVSAKEKAASRKEAQLARAIIESESEAERLEQEYAERLAREKERFEKQLDRERKQAEKAFNAKDAMRRRVQEYQDFEKALNGASPDRIIEKIDSLKGENQQLKHQISSAGHNDLEQENTSLKQRNEALEGRLRDLEPDYEQAKAELSRRRIASTEKQNLVSEKRVLEQHKKVLNLQVNDLVTRIDQLAESQQAQNAFPALSKMDKDEQSQIAPHLDEVPDLMQFAPELQRRIAYAEKDVVLYYQLQDIQLLLGGLAMSQLHVFQGISGTGKTSLAKAFAKAMGGGCITIPVQAGWRDRDDLLGYYNAFEKRFYEKDCLQGLYLAQTPAYSDRCNIILLDEMNLSRPEQYFSEFLSALEINSSDERLVTLSESELSNAPKLLVEGRKIRVPQNLCFIGTANQDETTNELADKTYDRAHVMILPKHEGGIELERIEPQKFSWRSLQKRFADAQKSHAQTVKELLEEVETSNLTTLLEERFDLGWGNRFKRQAMQFIPVVMAAGGSQEMALDHLFATRILRNGKVVGRYDTQVDDLNELRVSLNEVWKGWGGKPNKCNALLDKDIRRKEGHA